MSNESSPFWDCWKLFGLRPSRFLLYVAADPLLLLGLAQNILICCGLFRSIGLYPKSHATDGADSRISCWAFSPTPDAKGDKSLGLVCDVHA